ncbi:hypothetical protein BpOF4_16310 [Alkalihalophilus pseudofirmus OF4]|uniref:Uncharacterized protein n=2 Tax=Alkalihalophilus pseudofirmus TaxID=79885 RepID=D3FQ14_ALKPO|nr:MULTISPECIES: hypothetical protein [Alkalihalophilus]ADC51307.1 hypothetical protein BpOF4_16310 [Alkalihalophilus pseudofirmus OF4]MDV2884496.1 hypothetical protein [Alkalihalophilus pseudofirmus]MED1601890.1 hypothetical protein [Alkalihalophilus marmarensis]OLS38099.1 hypothetical protein BTR22_06250 [Alkalihalophilus pseudofirmus]WEG18740.1 hypothetical protein PQ478_09710 [Alkalihalophilus pseudofirmus]
MIDYVIRAAAGFVILLILLFLGPYTNIEWLQPSSPYRFLIVPIALIGSWVCLYLYRKLKQKKSASA